MIAPNLSRRMVFAALLFSPGVVLGADRKSVEADFHRGYYLQTHDHNPAAAAKAFEKVLAALDASDALHTQAKLRLAQCREDLAAEDLARLMPPEAVAYIEVDEPGANIARLAEMMGLIRPPGEMPAPVEGATAPTPGVPLGNGFFFPEDFAISPALVDEISKIKGAAAAITGLDKNEEPVGVVVLHPGDSDLLRGVTETAIQVLHPEPPLTGFKAYSFQGLWHVAVTSRLFIAARTRDELAATIGRIKDPKAPNLAALPTFKKVAAQREGSLVFAYVDGKGAYENFLKDLQGQDANIARTLLDLEHLNSVTAYVRPTETGLEVLAEVDLAEGHRNLAYGLIRTAPFTKRSLSHVPEGAAVVALLGLNPPTEVKTPTSNPEGHYYLTGMDVGREIFNNIEEIAVFVRPPASGFAAAVLPFSEVGAVIVAKDPAKSEALWSQLLALPALFGGGKSQPPRPITIAGHEGTEFPFPNIPPIALVRYKDRAVLAGTRSAVAAAIQASESGKSVLTDEAFKAGLARLTPDSSKGVLVHAGRSVAIAKNFVGGKDGRQLAQIGELLDELTVSVITNEHPTKFTVRVEATGLPNVSEIIRAVARTEQAKKSQNRQAGKQIQRRKERENVPAEASASRKEAAPAKKELKRKIRAGKDEGSRTKQESSHRKEGASEKNDLPLEFRTGDEQRTAGRQP